MHGFLGSDGLPPAALLAAGRDEVAGYGGHLLSGTVTDVKACPSPTAATATGHDSTFGSRTAGRCTPAAS
jgi:hypothetical protein